MATAPSTVDQRRRLLELAQGYRITHAVGLPVELGFAASLQRPGGNMTGVTYEAGHETYGKRLQILKEAVPRLTRIGVLAVSGDLCPDRQGRRSTP